MKITTKSSFGKWKWQQFRSGFWERKDYYLQAEWVFCIATPNARPRVKDRTMGSKYKIYYHETTRSGLGLSSVMGGITEWSCDLLEQFLIVSVNNSHPVTHTWAVGP